MLHSLLDHLLMPEKSNLFNEAQSGVNTKLDGDTYPGSKIGWSVSQKK